MIWVIPIAALITLWASCWDFMWRASGTETRRKSLTLRGLVVAIFGIITLAFSLLEYKAQTESNRDLLLRISREGTRINPTDFSCRLWISLAGTQLPTEYVPPDELSFAIRVVPREPDHSNRATAVAIGMLTLQPSLTWRDVDSPFTVGKLTWYYFSHNMVASLWNLQYLDELDEKRLSLEVRRERLGAPFTEGPWRARVHADVYVKGRWYIGNADPEGVMILHETHKARERRPAEADGFSVREYHFGPTNFKWWRLTYVLLILTVGTLVLARVRVAAA